MMWIKTDDDGRLNAVVHDEVLSDGFTEASTPDGFDANDLRDWVFVDGEWTYDPLPDPEPEIDRLTAVEMQLAALCGEPCEGV